MPPKTVKVRYKANGTPDVVDVLDAGLKGVARGDVIEVPHEVAYGREGVTTRPDGSPLDPDADFEQYVAPKGGLLDQEDAWELADTKAKRPDRTEPATEPAALEEL